MTRILEGTGAEIAKLLDRDPLSTQRLRVYIDDELSVSEVPTPPNTIRDRAHLEELLLKGYEGEPIPVTDKTWAQLHERINNPASNRQS